MIEMSQRVQLVLKSHLTFHGREVRHSGTCLRQDWPQRQGSMNPSLALLQSFTVSMVCSASCSVPIDQGTGWVAAMKPNRSFQPALCLWHHCCPHILRRLLERSAATFFSSCSLFFWGWSQTSQSCNAPSQCVRLTGLNCAF